MKRMVSSAARTAWRVRPTIYGPIRIPDSITMLATWPCTDSPLQAMMALAMATFSFSGATAWLAAKVPRSISKNH